MRIQPTGKSPAVGPASPAQQDKSAAASVPAGTDHVDLSTLSRAATGLTPARIEQLQAHVQSGGYQVNAAEVSRSMVDFYLIPIK
jgi:anti-sigma28 factor (negative regulator of flagellin synthesis)